MMITWCDVSKAGSSDSNQEVDFLLQDQPLALLNGAFDSTRFDFGFLDAF